MQIAPVVSVIIVTWNSKAHLPRCLTALSVQTFHKFEVIIVDNGSTDGALDQLSNDYPDMLLHIERLRYNMGFAVANNLGARLARGQWLALLNADAFPEPAWLAKLLLAAESNSEYSCFSSRQIQANNPDFLDGAGDSYHVSGMAWRNKMGYPAKEYALSKEEIFSPCAAAALYSCAAFLEVGGFDEDFLSYYEDVDLGFRLRLRGYRSLYVPDAIVHHVGSATFGVLSDFAFFHSHRNLVWTFFKNMPAVLLLRYLPAHVIANIIYVLYYTFHGRGKVLWRAKWDALRRLPKVLKKRKEIQKIRKVTDNELLRIMKHGWLQPFLLGYRLRQVLTSSHKDR